MTELNTLLKILAAQAGQNPDIRQSLVKTLLAAIEEESPPEQANTEVVSYLELLEQIAQQQREAEHAGKTKLSAAFRQLRQQIKNELIASALSLHQVLGLQMPAPDSRLIQLVGVNVQHFPTGFGKSINLLNLSKSYVNAVNDWHLLRANFPETLPEITHKIEQEEQTAARTLRNVAWKVLSTGLFTDTHLFDFHLNCLQAIQSQRPAAERELRAFLAETAACPIAERLSRFEQWLHAYYFHADVVINALSQADRETALALLIRSRGFAPMEILLDCAPISDDTAANDHEYAVFTTLMILRFGSAFVKAGNQWKNWLARNINDALQKPQTLEFWQKHPYYLPALLANVFGNAAIPDALNVKLKEACQAVTLNDFLKRRRSSMTAPEIQAVEAILNIQPEPLKSAEEQPLTSALLKAIAKTAVETAITGEVSDSTMISGMERESKVVDTHLTVTVDEQEEKPAARVHFTRPPRPVSLKKERKAAKAAKEPTESVWRDHIFPFISKNLVFVLAPSLIFIGLLLLVFTLWNKAAWIRYGLTPFMLVGVSYTLARIGVWLKGEEVQSETPTAILGSVAMLLAPMSLLFVAMLSVDQQLSLPVKVIWGIGLSAALLTAWSRVFTLSIHTVYQATARIHAATLLLLNALLLLLPVAQLTMTAENDALNLTAKAILVTGFYVGFLVLGWSMRRVLGTMMSAGNAGAVRVPTTFYAVTCLGTFSLVWGLTHARLMVLPQPATYAPLLVLASFFMAMTEFKLLAILQKSGRMTSLSYVAYFLIGLGILLSIPDEYLRVLTLLLAGAVWFYQGLKLRDTRHLTVALALMTGACSGVALIHNFPAPFFPYLALAIAMAVYGVARIPLFQEVGAFLISASSVYLSFAFLVSIIWQWNGNFAPFHFGVGFALFGVYALYLGAKNDRLIAVHAGMGYIVAALPYLGFMDIQRQTFEGNTLVFGLAVIGVIWIGISSVPNIPAFRDSRSTVLWNIGILAFCLMCVRLILKESVTPDVNLFLQFQTLSGPIIVGGLMFLVGYFTRSYVPVYFALVILVVIFPEIKDRFDIPMYTGLGSTCSGIGFLSIALMLSFWRPPEPAQLDLIWRKKAFPYQAKNHAYLFANPLVVAAFCLLTRTMSVTYLSNLFFSQMPFSIRTLVAVLLCGTCYHFFSVWFRKSFFSYIGFVAICVAVIHSCLMDAGSAFDWHFLPLFILFALLYCGGIWLVSRRILPPENAKLIAAPFRHFTLVTLWLLAMIFYLLYSAYMFGEDDRAFFVYWLPLGAYLCVVASWLPWHVKQAKHSWIFLPPAFLLFWQLLALTATLGSPLWFLFEFSSPFYVTTALMLFGVAAAFFLVERFAEKERFLLLSPLLWMSAVVLLLLSPQSIFWFYAMPESVPNLLLQIFVYALASLVIGRFLNVGPLWLWSIFLLHLLVVSSVGGSAHFYLSLHPFALALIAIVFALLSVLTVKFPALYEHKFAYSWARIRLLSPSFLFAAAAHVVVIAVFIQAINFDYRHEWMTTLGMFFATLPALFAAHQLGWSRHFLFGLPYSIAWVGLAFAVKAHFPEQGWLTDLHALELIGCGLFGALLTAVISDAVRPSQDHAYHALKVCGAILMIGVVAAAYLVIKDVERLNAHWLLTCGILSLGAGMYFRYLDHEK